MNLCLDAIYLGAANITDAEIQSGASDSIWIKLVPIIISSAALCISFLSAAFTAYHQYFKKPKLRCLLSRGAECYADPQGRLQLVTGITIFNEGAQYGSVYKMEVDLWHEETQRSIGLRWHMFMEPKNAAALGTKFQPHNAFAGWADTLVVPNRAAIYKRVKFYSKEFFEFIPGMYHANFELFEGVGPTVTTEVATTFVISESLAKAYGETKADAETKISARSIAFDLDQVKSTA